MTLLELVTQCETQLNSPDPYKRARAIDLLSSVLLITKSQDLSENTGIIDLLIL